MRISEIERDQDSTTANNATVDGTGLGLGIGVAIGSASILSGGKWYDLRSGFFGDFRLNLLLEELDSILEPVTKGPFAWGKVQNTDVVSKVDSGPQRRSYAERRRSLSYALVSGPTVAEPFTDEVCPGY